MSAVSTPKKIRVQWLPLIKFTPGYTQSRSELLSIRREYESDESVSTQSTSFKQLKTRQDKKSPNLIHAALGAKEMGAGHVGTTSVYTEKASEAHEAGKKIPSVMHEQPRMLYVHTAMDAKHARVVQVD